MERQHSQSAEGTECVLEKQAVASPSPGYTHHEEQQCQQDDGKLEWKVDGMSGKSWSGRATHFAVEVVHTPQSDPDLYLFHHMDPEHRGRRGEMNEKLSTE